MMLPDNVVFIVIGITVPTVICKEYNLPVDDHFCDITKKPSEAPELCNTHLCPPE